MSSELRLIRVMMKAGSFTGMWPPFFEKRRFCLWAWNVLWLLILTNFAFLLTFMLLSFYVDRPKIADSVEAITMMCILGQLIVNQVTWKLYEKRVRVNSFAKVYHHNFCLCIIPLIYDSNCRNACTKSWTSCTSQPMTRKT